MTDLKTEEGREDGRERKEGREGEAGRKDD